MKRLETLKTDVFWSENVIFQRFKLRSNFHFPACTTLPIQYDSDCHEGYFDSSIPGHVFEQFAGWTAFERLLIGWKSYPAHDIVSLPQEDIIYQS